MKLQFGYATDIGTDRLTNQDSLGIFCASFACSPVVLAVCCDGMGGLENGEYASAYIVKQFEKWFSDTLPELLEEHGDNSQIVNSVESVIRYSNRQLISRHNSSEMKEMGTTMSALLIIYDIYYLFHIGDSRIYRIDSESAIQLTTDQSLVQSLLDRNIISKSEAETDSRRNVLLQCIGIRDSVRPEENMGRISEEASFLLCSDGFWHYQHNESIFRYLSKNPPGDGELSVRNLIRMINENKKNGEDDNLTAVFVRFSMQDEAIASMKESSGDTLRLVDPSLPKREQLGCMDGQDADYEETIFTTESFRILTKMVCIHTEKEL